MEKKTWNLNQVHIILNMFLLCHIICTLFKKNEELFETSEDGDYVLWNDLNRN